VFIAFVVGLVILNVPSDSGYNLGWFCSYK